MVKFVTTAGGFEVLVDQKRLGYIDEQRGFFTSPCDVNEFVEVSPADLRTIAQKAEELKERLFFKKNPFNGRHSQLD